MPNKRFAEHQEASESRCYHSHAPFIGQIPNTGQRVCSMCGSIVPKDYVYPSKREIRLLDALNDAADLIDTLEGDINALWGSKGNLGRPESYFARDVIDKATGKED